MNRIITRSLWMLFLIIQSTLMYAQTNTITGTVTDENGETLPGVTILIKGTANGTITSVDGDYSLDLKESNIVLVFSFTGYNDVELTADQPVLDVQMGINVTSLDEIVVTGIRGAQLRSTAAKRNAETVVEEITPEDIGSFSDDNVADALQRVPGVQIERNVDGVSGDRVSIRGVGPEFVQVTINGRTPISAGSEGRADLRTFNLNSIPTEIISGATISKTSQSKNISTSIGGNINFRSIRPLDKKYKDGKKYFAGAEVRGTSNTPLGDLDVNERISGNFGGKINDKLGFAVSAVYSGESRIRDESALRGYRFLDLREDTNNDSIFNVADGDQIYENVLVPATHNNQYIRDNKNNIAFTAALQYNPSEKLEFLFDYSNKRRESKSDRQFFQMSLASGGNGGLLGQSDDNFFSPGSFELNGNNLLFVDAAGASTSKVSIRNRNTLFDNYTNNVMTGLNTKYKASDRLEIHLDVSYSSLDYFQSLNIVGTHNLTGNNYDKDDFSFDLRGERAFYTLPDEAFDPAAYSLSSSSIRHIRTKGENYASKIDLAYAISKKTHLRIGTNIAINDIETREAGAGTAVIGGYTEEQKAEIFALRSAENNLTEGEFLSGKTGLSRWISTPGQAILDLTPEFAALDGGSVFDFNTPLNEVQSEEGNLVLNSPRSFGSKETNFSSYAQLNTKTTLFKVPLVLNFGVRALRVDNVSSGFTGVNQRDPITEIRTTVNSAVFHTVENRRWDIIPGFNALFKIKKNINYRFSVTRGNSRPRYRNLVPRNNVEYLDPESEIFDPNSPEFISDLASSTYRGTIRKGDPNLKPRQSWGYDNTFEYYTKNGSSFTASIHYKDIQNYVGRRILINQAYPGEEELGITLPEGQEDLLFDISTPVNISNASLLGFELGFNQHFTFLPGFAKGFGLRANYSFTEGSFDDASLSDETVGFPGTSKHNVNGIMYYEKYGLSVRFTAAYRSNYLSNIGGVGNTRADEAHYTNGNTTLGLDIKYKITKNIRVSLGARNMTGVDIRRYIGDDTRNLTSYYGRNPTWTVGLRWSM